LKAAIGPEFDILDLVEELSHGMGAGSVPAELLSHHSPRVGVDEIWHVLCAAFGRKEFETLVWARIIPNPSQRFVSSLRRHVDSSDEMRSLLTLYKNNGQLLLHFGSNCTLTDFRNMLWIVQWSTLTDIRHAQSTLVA